MEIVRTSLPFLVELDETDITLMHLALYEYKALLKKNKRINPAQKRLRMFTLCRMIALVDLMM